MTVPPEDYMTGKCIKGSDCLRFRYRANHAGEAQLIRKRQGMGENGILIILNQGQVLDIFQNFRCYRGIFTANMVGNNCMIIVALYRDHTVFPQWSQAGFDSFRPGRIANITEVVNAPAIQTLEHVKRGQDGLGIPVTVGHDSDHCLLR